MIKKDINEKHKGTKQKDVKSWVLHYLKQSGALEHTELGEETKSLESEVQPASTTP